MDFHTGLNPQNETHDCELSPILTETMLRMHHAHNGMLNHYNHIVVGCFKEIIQTVDTNNLPAALQALKDLNFILANRAPELPAHYGFPLEPCQISTEEVPDFVSAYLSRPTTNPPKYSSRGRPRTRGNHQYRPQGNLYQCIGITTMAEPGKLTDQMHTLILIDYIKKISLLINLDIVTGTGITHIHHQKH